MSANGKALHGAAETSFVKNCKRDTCASKAAREARRYTVRPRKLHEEAHDEPLVWRLRMRARWPQALLRATSGGMRHFFIFKSLPLKVLTIATINPS